MRIPMIGNRMRVFALSTADFLLLSPRPRRHDTQPARQGALIPSSSTGSCWGVKQEAPAPMMTGALAARRYLLKGETSDLTRVEDDHSPGWCAKLVPSCGVPKRSPAVNRAPLPTALLLTFFCRR